MSPEVIKLARLLRVPPERVAYLEPVPEAELRGLRESVTDRLFDADRGFFDRLAAAAGIVPDALAATLSRKSFGPLLTARIAAAVDPHKAVSVARRLPDAFLADVAVEMDPRRAVAVLRGLPPSQIARSSVLLAEREEWVTMGRFVGHLRDDAIREVTNVLDDDALVRIAYVLDDDALVRIAYVLEDPDQFERVARIVGEPRATAIRSRL